MEIARLEDLRAGVIEDRVEADLALGHHADVVGELKALVAECPLREQLQQQLMVALYRCGRQPEALAAYQAARRTMVEELGIEPSPALQRVERAILAHDAWLDPPPRAMPPSARAQAGDRRRSPAGGTRRRRLLAVAGTSLAVTLWSCCPRASATTSSTPSGPCSSTSSGSGSHAVRAQLIPDHAGRDVVTGFGHGCFGGGEIRRVFSRLKLCSGFGRHDRGKTVAVTGQVDHLTGSGAFLCDLVEMTSGLGDRHLTHTSRVRAVLQTDRPASAAPARRPAWQEPRAPGSCQGRASKTRLNGVSAARRNRLNPAVPMTSAIRASPACAPRASPTSCDRDAGVHSSVENE